MTVTRTRDSSAHPDQLFALDASTRLAIERAYHQVASQLRLDSSHRQLAVWSASQSRCEPLQVAALICLLGLAREQGRLGLALDALPGEVGWSVVSEAFSVPSITVSLAETGLVAQVDDGDDPRTARTILVVEDGVLYLQRDWCLRHELVRHLKRLSDGPPDSAAADRDTAALEDLNITPSPGQHQAIEALSGAQIGLLAGGPGTGKTTVINSLLRVLMDPGDDAPRHIHVLAPTGKAVARLADSLEADIAVRVQVSTVHRLLGWLPDGRGFRHHSGHRLAAEVVIVDEASMVDLELMVLLLDALNDGCRLYLVGDPNQLSSIEPGHVFGDLWSRDDAALVHCSLSEQFRFSADSAITRLSSAVLAGDSSAVIATLAEAPGEELIWLKTRDLTPGALVEQLPERLKQAMIDGDADQMLAVINQCRILCPQRYGPWGTESINRLLRDKLRRSAESDLRQATIVMVTRNDYSLSLFNGDQGLLLQQADGSRRLLFPEGDRVRTLESSQLSEWIDAFAMTIHKAQGSEYQQVIVVLPDADSPLLTRELLYTAITRCRQRLILIADEPALQQAVSRSGRQAGQLPAWPE